MMIKIKFFFFFSEDDKQIVDENNYYKTSLGRIFFGTWAIINVLDEGI